jgi:hypothetical protein
LKDDWAKGLDRKVIKQRLRVLQQAVGVLSDMPGGVPDAQMGEWAGVGRTAWGNYLSGLRPIPPHAAVALKLRWGVSLDWIYAGDASKNDPALQIKLDEAMRNPIPVKRGPKSIKRKWTALLLAAVPFDYNKRTAADERVWAWLKLQSSLTRFTRTPLTISGF